MRKPDVKDMPRVPSAFKDSLSKCCSEDASSNRPPAPSPNKTAVERSFQSKTFESTSPPMTNPFLAPVRISFSAIDNAYTKPAHAALISKAKALTAPIAPWTWQATAGVLKSGVIVATKIKSRLSAES